jgi:hypothetical protein
VGPEVSIPVAQVIELLNSALRKRNGYRIYYRKVSAPKKKLREFRNFVRPIPNLTPSSSSSAARDSISVAVPIDLPRLKKSNFERC